MESGSKVNRMAQQERDQDKQVQYNRMERGGPSEAAMCHLWHKPYSVCNGDAYCGVSKKYFFEQHN